MIGSDLLARRDDWKVMNNPFAPAGTEDPIVLLPAIRPDFAIYHAPLADRFGNVWIGRKRELLNMSQAAFASLVTVEEVTDRNLMHDEKLAAGCVPAIYVSGIAEAKRGAAPIGLWDLYGIEDDVMQRYVAMAKTEDGFRQFLADFLAIPDSVKAAA